MAKLSYVLEIESQRASAESYRVINLFNDNGFYHAYEWSAWLYCRYIHEFNVTKKQYKSVSAPVVFVGYPFTSLQKYTPEDAVLSQREDGSIAMALPATLIPEDIDVEAMRTEYANWKQSQPFSEDKPSAAGGVVRDSPAGLSLSSTPEKQRPGRLTEIMHRIIAYPIEQKSPLDCMQFLAETKKNLSEII